MILATATLHLGTVVPALIGVTLVRVLVMGHYALHRRVYPGFRTLLAAELLVFFGMGVFMLRVWAGELLPLVFLANATVLGHPVLVYLGVGEYCRVPHLRRRNRQNIAFVAFICLLQLADVLFDPSMSRRVLVFSVAAALLALRIGLELPWASRRRLPGMRFLCFSYLITASFHVLRFVSVLGLPEYRFETLLQQDLIGTYAIFFRILQTVLELYVVFAMNSAMLENDLQVATSQVERMAQTDALTGILNRRGMELLGMEALRRSYALGMPAAVIMLDLDWFKQVNDNLGHAAGDELLRSVAALCVSSLRREDVFARFGGEEFVVIAPQTGVREAGLLAQRMRASIEGARFPSMNGARVTASFGVAGSRSATLAELLKSADAALYESKQSGRNRVVIAVPEMARGAQTLGGVLGETKDEAEDEAEGA
ncbi:MAG: GGDEF domain-containing protein [Humidesulfovibrio sp.]|nr:GGDEF domain-containing protein [Humidesulfovibrio sp.]